MAEESSTAVALAEQSAPPRPEPTTSRRHWALNILGFAGIIGICYFAQSVLVVILVSVLLAFILAPVVELLMFFRLPRGLAAAIALVLLIAVLCGIVYYSYNQAADFVQDLPKYTGRIRDKIARFRKEAESFEVLAPPREKGVLNVRTTTDFADLLTRGFGSASGTILAASFVPFLVYFMLSWQEHVRSATVMLFPMKNRNTAYVTLGLISAMIRSFMVGNLLIGLLIGAASTALFWYLNLPFFYFAGFISGFLSLVPYLGTLLALVPPIFVGLGHMPSESVATIVVGVVGLHVVAVNMLYPKLLGNRMALNPLAVTIGLLVWGTLWGAMGLLLAVPLTAAIKIVFDHVEMLRPYGAWLGV